MGNPLAFVVVKPLSEFLVERGAIGLLPIDGLCRWCPKCNSLERHATSIGGILAFAEQL